MNNYTFIGTRQIQDHHGQTIEVAMLYDVQNNVVIQAPMSPVGTNSAPTPRETFPPPLNKPVAQAENFFVPRKIVSEQGRDEGLLDPHAVKKELPYGAVVVDRSDLNGLPKNAEGKPIIPNVFRTPQGRQAASFMYPEGHPNHKVITPDTI